MVLRVYGDTIPNMHSTDAPEIKVKSLSEDDEDVKIIADTIQKEWDEWTNKWDNIICRLNYHNTSDDLNHLLRQYNSELKKFMLRYNRDRRSLRDRVLEHMRGLHSYYEDNECRFMQKTYFKLMLDILVTHCVLEFSLVQPCLKNEDPQIYTKKLRITASRLYAIIANHLCDNYVLAVQVIFKVRKSYINAYINRILWHMYKIALQNLAYEEYTHESFTAYVLGKLEFNILNNTTEDVAVVEESAMRLFSIDESTLQKNKLYRDVMKVNRNVASIMEFLAELDLNMLIEKYLKIVRRRTVKYLYMNPEGIKKSSIIKNRLSSQEMNKEFYKCLNEPPPQPAKDGGHYVACRTHDSDSEGENNDETEVVNLDSDSEEKNIKLKESTVLSRFIDQMKELDNERKNGLLSSVTNKENRKPVVEERRNSNNNDVHLPSDDVICISSDDEAYESSKKSKRINAEAKSGSQKVKTTVEATKTNNKRETVEESESNMTKESERTKNETNNKTQSNHAVIEKLMGFVSLICSNLQFQNKMANSSNIDLSQLPSTSSDSLNDILKRFSIGDISNNVYCQEERFIGDNIQNFLKETTENVSQKPENVKRVTLEESTNENQTNFTTKTSSEDTINKKEKLSEVIEEKLSEQVQLVSIESSEINSQKSPVAVPNEKSTNALENVQLANAENVSTETFVENETATCVSSEKTNEIELGNKSPLNSEESNKNETNESEVEMEIAQEEEQIDPQSKSIPSEPLGIIEDETIEQNEISETVNETRIDEQEGEFISFTQSNSDTMECDKLPENANEITPDDFDKRTAERLDDGMRDDEPITNLSDTTIEIENVNPTEEILIQPNSNLNNAINEVEEVISTEEIVAKPTSNLNDTAIEVQGVISTEEVSIEQNSSLTDGTIEIDGIVLSEEVSTKQNCNLNDGTIEDDVISTEEASIESNTNFNDGTIEDVILAEGVSIESNSNLNDDLFEVEDVISTEGVSIESDSNVNILAMEVDKVIPSGEALIGSNTNLSATPVQVEDFPTEEIPIEPNANQHNGTIEEVPIAVLDRQTLLDAIPLNENGFQQIENEFIVKKILSRKEEMILDGYAVINKKLRRDRRREKVGVEEMSRGLGNNNKIIIEKKNKKNLIQEERGLGESLMLNGVQSVAEDAIGNGETCETQTNSLDFKYLDRASEDNVKRKSIVEDGRNSPKERSEKATREILNRNRTKADRGELIDDEFASTFAGPITKSSQNNVNRPGRGSTSPSKRQAIVASSPASPTESPEFEPLDQDDYKDYIDNDFKNKLTTRELKDVLTKPFASALRTAKSRPDVKKSLTFDSVVRTRSITPIDHHHHHHHHHYHQQSEWTLRPTVIHDDVICYVDPADWKVFNATVEPLVRLEETELYQRYFADRIRHNTVGSCIKQVLHKHEPAKDDEDDDEDSETAELRAPYSGTVTYDTPFVSSAPSDPFMQVRRDTDSLDRDGGCSSIRLDENCDLGHETGREIEVRTLISDLIVTNDNTTEINDNEIEMNDNVSKINYNLVELNDSVIVNDNIIEMNDSVIEINHNVIELNVNVTEMSDNVIEMDVLNCADILSDTMIVSNTVEIVEASPDSPAPPLTIGEESETVEGSPRTADESPRISGEGTIIAEESTRIAVDSPRIDENSPRVADESTGIAEEFPAVDDARVNNDGSKLEKMSPTSPLFDETPTTTEESFESKEIRVKQDYKGDETTNCEEIVCKKEIAEVETLGFVEKHDDDKEIDEKISHSADLISPSKLCYVCGRLGLINSNRNQNKDVMNRNKHVINQNKDLIDQSKHLAARTYNYKLKRDPFVKHKKRQSKTSGKVARFNCCAYCHSALEGRAGGSPADARALPDRANETDAADYYEGTEIPRSEVLVEPKIEIDRDDGPVKSEKDVESNEFELKSVELNESEARSIEIESRNREEFLLNFNLRREIDKSKKHREEVKHEAKPLARANNNCRADNAKRKLKRPRKRSAETCQKDDVYSVSQLDDGKCKLGLRIIRNSSFADADLQRHDADARRSYALDKKIKKRKRWSSNSDPTYKPSGHFSKGSMRDNIYQAVRLTRSQTQRVKEEFRIFVSGNVELSSHSSRDSYDDDDDGDVYSDDGVHAKKIRLNELIYSRARRDDDDSTTSRSASVCSSINKFGHADDGDTDERNVAEEKVKFDEVKERVEEVKKLHGNEKLKEEKKSYAENEIWEENETLGEPQRGMQKFEDFKGNVEADRDVFETEGNGEIKREEIEEKTATGRTVKEKIEIEYEDISDDETKVEGVYRLAIPFASLSPYPPNFFSAENVPNPILDMRTRIVEGQLPNVESQIPTMQAQITTINAHISTVDAQIPTMNAQIPSMNSQISTMNSKIPTVNSQVPSMKPKISIISAQIPTMEAQIPTIESQIPAIENQIPAIENQIPMVDNQIPMIDNQIPMIESQISAIEGQIENQIQTSYNIIDARAYQNYYNQFRDDGDRPTYIPVFTAPTCGVTTASYVCASWSYNPRTTYIHHLSENVHRVPENIRRVSEGMHHISEKRKSSARPTITNEERIRLTKSANNCVPPKKRILEQSVIDESAPDSSPAPESVAVLATGSRFRTPAQRKEMPGLGYDRRSVAIESNGIVSGVRLPPFRYPARPVDDSDRFVPDGYV